MEVIQTEVTGTRSKTLPFDEIILCPVGDLQYGAEGCDLDRFQRHISWVVSQPNAYLLGMGDLIDLASPSNREKLKSMRLYDTTENAINQAARQMENEVKEILAPSKGRWLGMVSGHHHWVDTQEGHTSDQKFAQFVGCPFLGDSAIVNLKFKIKNSPILRIFMHHGQGSGINQSSPINKLEHFANSWDNIDIFFMAHHHKKVAAKIQRISVIEHNGKTKLRHRNVIIAGTGGFLKGYEMGSQYAGRPAGNYVEQKMLAPVALGAVIVWARPKLIDDMPSVDLDISL